MNICLTKYVQSELDEDDGGDDDRVVCESKCTEVTKKREEEKKKRVPVCTERAQAGGRDKLHLMTCSSCCADGERKGFSCKVKPAFWLFIHSST